MLLLLLMAWSLEVVLASQSYVASDQLAKSTPWAPKDFILAWPVHLTPSTQPPGVPPVAGPPEASKTESGQPPNTAHTGLAKTLWTGADEVAACGFEGCAPEPPRAQSAEPQDFGTNAGPYTSSRDFGTRTAYPNAAVVKIYFKVGTSYASCSGSMIKRGIVLTAGHCVHDGVSAWYSSFQVIPGFYRSGSTTNAPFGYWYAQRLYTTTAWASGGGGVPNVGDYALIVLWAKQDRFAGHYTGYLGTKTNSAAVNHVTALGYPGNFDSGYYPHSVYGQTSLRQTGIAVMGSDMRGGSSGGPWVQNWAVLSTGQTARSGLLLAVSVVSFGPVSTTSYYQGGPVLTSVFTQMLSTACSQYPAQCGP